MNVIVRPSQLEHVNHPSDDGKLSRWKPRPVTGEAGESHRAHAAIAIPAS
jgi:hypothetical protein